MVFTWIQCKDLPYQPNHPFPDCLFCSALSSICYHKGTCQLTSPVTTTMTLNLPIVSYKLYTHYNISPSLWYQPCTIVVVVQEVGNVWLERERPTQSNPDTSSYPPHSSSNISNFDSQHLGKDQSIHCSVYCFGGKEIEKKKRVSKRKRRPEVKRSDRERTKNAKMVRFQGPPL